MTWTEHEMNLVRLDDEVAVFETEGGTAGSSLRIPREAWNLRKTATLYVTISHDPVYEALHRDARVQEAAAVERVRAQLDKNHEPRVD